MPTLSIDIEARFAKFQDGLDKISRDVDRSVGRMSKSFGTLKSVAAGFIGTFAGIATVGGIKSVINDLEKLNTVSERTGIAAKELSGLAFAASQTGTDLEVMAKGINKLNIALSQLSSGKNKDLKEILTQLGLPEFAKGAIDAEEALLQLAEVFPRLSEADQARVALETFGKAGVELIPVLKGGRKALEDFIKTGNELFPATNNLAKAADDFNDSMDAVALALKGTLLPLLDSLLPKLTKIASGFTDARRAGLGFFEWVAGLASSRVTQPFGNLQDRIKATAEELDKLRKLPQVKTFTSDVPARIKHLEGMQKYFKLQAESDALASTGGVDFDEGRFRKRAEADIKLPPKPSKGGRTRAADRDDSAQRLLDQQLQAFERSIDEERDLAASRNEFLDRFYAQGLVSLGDYTAKKKAYLDESVQAQTEAINGEIALLAKSRAKQPADDRIATDTKINELIAKRIALQDDANVESLKLFLDSRDAANETAGEYQQINIELLEMQGRFEEAARARFELDNAGRFTKLATEGEKGATPQERESARQAAEKLDTIGKISNAQAAFNKELEITNRIRNDYADKEERIQLAVQSGSVGQIDALRQIGLLRQDEAKSLAHQIKLMEQINKAAESSALTDQIKAAKIELDRLNASLDPLRDNMEGLVTDGFSNFFDKLASGTVSAKDAFRELFKEILGGLAKMGKDDFLKQVFGKDGTFGGVASFLAGSDDRKIMNQDFGKRDEPARVQQTGGFGGFLGSFFNRDDPNRQAAAPISEGVASSFGVGNQSGAGAEAALALKEVATSSTATSFALKEFADDGVASATQQMFENVSAGVIEQSADQAATGAMTGLTVAANLAAAALNSMASQKFAGSVAGAVQSSAGGYAEGGQITGAGTGTSDSIPVLLSNKEFVVRAKPTQEPGALAFLTRFNKMGMKSLQRLSAGGLVGRSLGMAGVAIAGAGVVYSPSFTIQAGTPRETQQQIASAAYQGGMSAYRRNR